MRMGSISGRAGVALVVLGFFVLGVAFGTDDFTVVVGLIGSLLTLLWVEQIRATNSRD